MTILALLLLICVGCDQATKAAAQHHLAFARPITYWGNLIRLEYAENPGGFLSLGAGLPASARYYVFIVAVSIMLGTAFLIMTRLLNTAPFRVMLALALVVGGGTGNLVSRLLNEGHRDRLYEYRVRPVADRHIQRGRHGDYGRSWRTGLFWLV